MRYLPKSPAERQEMLAAIGAKSIDELFSSIPERFRPAQSTKHSRTRIRKPRIIQYFKDRARGEFERVHEISRGRRLQSICAPW